MPRAKPLNNTQIKCRVIDKLRTAGINTEYDLLALSPADTVKLMPDITREEFSVILDLQKNVKDKRLYSYLCED